MTNFKRAYESQNIGTPEKRQESQKAITEVNDGNTKVLKINLWAVEQRKHAQNK